MRASECDIFILPGLGGGTPDHWYSRWSKKLSTARRLEQKTFDKPVLADWVETIVMASAAASKPVVVIAHSLGALAAVHAAARAPAVIGALLVAPPSREALEALPDVDPAFGAALGTPLSFPAILAASRNDSYCSYEAASAYAAAWNAMLVDAGEAGHVNPESGHGPWPEGLLRFAHFMGQLKSPAAEEPKKAKD